jgi:hypothetical protein
MKCIVAVEMALSCVSDGPHVAHSLGERDFDPPFSLAVIAVRIDARWHRRRVPQEQGGIT